MGRGTFAGPRVRLIEVDVDTKAYEQGHIPGAVGFNWQKELQDQIVRAPLSKEHLGALLGHAGVSKDTTIVLYGDNNNWLVPWATAVRPDGTFKSAEELRAIYEGKGVTPDKEVIAYCRIGERSSHTWFALNYLLGYPDVRNYDGSWTEWGSLIGAPIER
ncbi:MAG: hypothetical protein NVS4B1_22450 [Ktedonobacteraceae bacterium]